jgi:hypothetical protein
LFGGTSGVRGDTQGLNPHIFTMLSSKRNKSAASNPSASTSRTRLSRRPHNDDDELFEVKLELAKEQLEHTRLLNHYTNLLNLQLEETLKFSQFSHVFPHELVYQMNDASDDMSTA